MYFKIKHTPTGQVLQLVEAYRNENGQPRYRLVASLGNAKIDKGHYAPIARMVERKLYGYTDLLTETTDKSASQWVDKIVRLVERSGRWHPLTVKSENTEGTTETTIVDGVISEKVTHSNNKELGPSLAGLHAWKTLRMPQLLNGLGFNDVQCKRAAISVINRLVDPVSENGLEAWLSTTALPEILGEQEHLGEGDDRFYRISDLLLKHKNSIESHIRQRQGELFNLDRTILLYDLTNSHFEGLCEENPKAKRGHNKQKRDDCLQIVVGMVFDREGFELAHQVFEGNKSDAKSLIEMIEHLEAFLDSKSSQTVLKQKPIVIVDAGIATQSNLALLREKGFSYLVNDSRRGRIRYHKEFKEDTQFTAIDNRDADRAVMVRLEKETHLDSQDKKFEEQVVLCKSAARGEKEKAILSNAEKRFLVDLEKLIKRVSAGQLKDLQKVQRAIGRIQNQHQRIQRYYTIELKSTDAQLPAISYSRKDELYYQQEALSGCYVLRTDQIDLDAQQIWRLYISLTRAEEGFRTLKSTLGLRPNPHHKEHRVDAHVFITVLAYQLLCFIRHTLESHDDKRSWETIRRVLQTHCYATITLPTKNGTVYHLRKAGQPEETQKGIYQLLGIDWNSLPQSRIAVQQKNTGDSVGPIETPPK